MIVSGPFLKEEVNFVKILRSREGSEMSSCLLSLLQNWVAGLGSGFRLGWMEKMSCNAEGLHNYVYNFGL